MNIHVDLALELEQYLKDIEANILSNKINSNSRMVLSD